MMAVALTTSSWPVEGLILLLMIGLTVFSARVRWTDMVHSASVPVGFVLFGTLAQAASLRLNGALPTVELTADALSKAAFVGIRSLACVAALLALALTTPLPDILRLLRRIGLGRDVGDIALMMFRFVWLLLDCVEHGRQSQANRLGYVGYRRSLGSIGMLMAALLPRVLSQAHRLETGLAARGYEGELNFIPLERPVSALRLGGIVAILIVVATFGRIGT
jgi:cobalt/nickel transport system permease protein